MDAVKIIQIVFSILGLLLIILGLFYSKNAHNKIDPAHGPFGNPIGEILFGILFILPWYIMKSMIILTGSFIFVLSLLSLIQDKI
jgi:hypothetical protein